MKSEYVHMRGEMNSNLYEISFRLKISLFHAGLKSQTGVSSFRLSLSDLISVLVGSGKHLKRHF